MIKLFPYVLFEKYIYILALEMASTENRHCANCIGTLPFAIAFARCLAVNVAFLNGLSARIDNFPTQVRITVKLISNCSYLLWRVQELWFFLTRQERQTFMMCARAIATSCGIAIRCDIHVAIGLRTKPTHPQLHLLRRTE